MRKSGSVRSALAAIGAASGTAFASGRAIVGYFAQLGGLSWLAIGVAAAAFGLLTGLCVRLAVRANADSFAALCRRSLGRGTARALGLLHGLLMAVAALTMLLWAARLGALTLPLKQSAAWGMGLSLLLAALLNRRKGCWTPAIGLALGVVGAAFYSALALDPRPPRLNFRGEVVLALDGNPAAALALSLSHAALSAYLAANAAARFSVGASPGRVGVLCGGGMALVLLAGNAALGRGGEALFAQALPLVLLAARWGIAGFWLCAGYGFCCATATLAAALAALSAWLRRGC